MANSSYVVYVQSGLRRLLNRLKLSICTFLCSFPTLHSVLSMTKAFIFYEFYFILLRDSINLAISLRYINKIYLMFLFKVIPFYTLTNI